LAQSSWTSERALPTNKIDLSDAMGGENEADEIVRQCDERCLPSAMSQWWVRLEQRGRHFGITEYTRPFAEGEVGGDDVEVRS